MMKKTLVALAAAAVAGGAFAQSAVTISGTVDLAYALYDVSSTVAADRDADQQRVMQNGSATTAIIISGSEDIGGGLRGIFRFETNPDFVAGGGLAAATGFNFVGLTGGFGEVRLGRLNSAFLQNWGIANPFGTNLGSGWGAARVVTRYAGGTTAPTRFNGAIEYQSPVFNGIQGRLMYVPEDTTPTSTVRPGVIDAGLRFAQGPFAAMLSWQQTDASRNITVNVPIGVTGNGVENTLWMLGGRFTMGATAFSAGYWQEEVEVAGVKRADITGWTLGVRHTMGPWAFLAAYTQSEDDATSPVLTTGGALVHSAPGDVTLAGGAGAKRTVLGLGADYSFSKRTALYGRFEARDLGVTEVQTIAVGIRHTF
jgi:predicted porin